MGGEEREEWFAGLPVTAQPLDLIDRQVLERDLSKSWKLAALTLFVCAVGFALTYPTLIASLIACLGVAVGGLFGYRSWRTVAALGSETVRYCRKPLGHGNPIGVQAAELIDRARRKPIESIILSRSGEVLLINSEIPKTLLPRRFGRAQTTAKFEYTRDRRPLSDAEAAEIKERIKDYRTFTLWFFPRHLMQSFALVAIGAKFLPMAWVLGFWAVSTGLMLLVESRGAMYLWRLANRLKWALQRGEVSAQPDGAQWLTEADLLWHTGKMPANWRRASFGSWDSGRLVYDFTKDLGP